MIIYEKVRFNILTRLIGNQIYQIIIDSKHHLNNIKQVISILDQIFIVSKSNYTEKIKIHVTK